MSKFADYIDGLQDKAGTLTKRGTGGEGHGGSLLDGLLPK